jgi:anthranilate synthase component 1
VAPTVRSYSGAFEPLDLLERFPERYPGLLESGAAHAGGSGARYDILPIASGETLSLSQGRLAGPHAGSGGFLAALESWWHAEHCSREAQPALPFSGGWLVYLGYELAGEVEPSLILPRSDDAYGALALRAPAAWIRDRKSSQQFLLAEAGFEALLTDFERDTRHAGAAACSNAAIDMQEEDPRIFLQAVAEALKHTAAGDVYQTNLSRLWAGVASEWLSPIEVYRRLRRANPSPFAACLRVGDSAILSSSPERLAAVRGDSVSTRPIAGTRPRGATQAADAALIQSLLANEKERAEHVMLIDLERNDLGRVCRGGTVQVDEFMTVETYAHVHHIVSNVSGRLRSSVSPIDVLRALFPGGTITGCPKVRCMQLIGDLEGRPRGAYTGSLGYLNRDGDCDFNILIRTVTVQGGAFKFRTGAGIVADSVAEFELAETRAKAEGLLRALDRPS